MIFDCYLCFGKQKCCHLLVALFISVNVKILKDKTGQSREMRTEIRSQIRVRIQVLLDLKAKILTILL